MSQNEVYVIGAGGHAKVVIACIRALGNSVVAVLDDDPVKIGSQVLGCAITGPINELKQGDSAVIAIGDGSIRQIIAGNHEGSNWTTLVHPRAYVHESAVIGEGAVVFAGAIVQPETRIGRHCIINTAASIDHDCCVGDFSHLAPGVHLAGSVTIGEKVLVGIGAVIKPGMKVGDGAMIGAGAVVVSDIPAGAVAFGVPARIRL